MPKIVVSLSTIPSRVPFLGHFLDSIERQSMQPDRIELNLPRQYTKRDLGTIDRKQIPSGFDVHDCSDFGPATKIIPTLHRYSNSDTKILYCDDDRIYHPSWIKRLSEMADRYPDSAIADECNSITAIEYRYNNPVKDWKYRMRRVASLGLYDPYKSSRKSEWDVVEGFGGVLVRPSFFDINVAAIPEVVWAVDDIWLSANLLSKGTKIRWTQRSNKERSRSLRIKGKNLGRLSDALTLSTFEDLDRAKADHFAVVSCRDRLGVWMNATSAE